MSRIARENTHFKLIKLKITGLFSVDTARKRKRPLESEYLFSLAFFPYSVRGENPIVIANINVEVHRLENFL